MEFIDVSCATTQREAPEPENLLEECWFFGNLLLDSKSKMSKSYSDLGPSNYNTRKEMSVIKSERSSSATPMKDPKGDDMYHPVKEKHNSGITQNNLIREQSLPPRLTRQAEDEDEESDFMLGRLIRQASLNSSHNLPPRDNSEAESSSFPTKYRPKKRRDQLESNNMDMKDKNLSDGTKIRTRSSDIEVKSLKTLSSIQGNSRDKTKEKMITKYSPAIPNWCDSEIEKRSSQDIKAEIKFWARAVASNVADIKSDLEVEPQMRFEKRKESFIQKHDSYLNSAIVAATDGGSAEKAELQKQSAEDNGSDSEATIFFRAT
ncbi:hypothetical protein POM88_006860 [Heracleum sosnowskyi]|uniref:Uncharacterized protein n=1 Tax=Heracleum sosnowskyi TaxID=360622 RepID=A0AAD8J3H0_9APIA|nr:hypothetical protein POM88_006860 [Heracleum sosnowskyi]